nr:hypothetical protein ISGA_1549 [Gordonia sp. NB41Y]
MTSEITYYPTASAANKHLSDTDYTTGAVLAIENPYTGDRLALTGNPDRMRYLLTLALGFIEAAPETTPTQ